MPELFPYPPVDPEVEVEDVDGGKSLQERLFELVQASTVVTYLTHPQTGLHSNAKWSAADSTAEFVLTAYSRKFLRDGRFDYNSLDELRQMLVVETFKRLGQQRFFPSERSFLYFLALGQKQREQRGRDAVTFCLLFLASLDDDRTNWRFLAENFGDSELSSEVGDVELPRSEHLTLEQQSGLVERRDELRELANPTDREKRARSVIRDYLDSKRHPRSGFRVAASAPFIEVDDSDERLLKSLGRLLWTGEPDHQLSNSEELFDLNKKFQLLFPRSVGFSLSPNDAGNPVIFLTAQFINLLGEVGEAIAVDCAILNECREGEALRLSGERLEKASWVHKLMAQARERLVHRVSEEKHREVLRDYLYGMKNSEVATRQNIAAPTASNRYRRAKAELASQLRVLGVAPEKASDEHTAEYALAVVDCYVNGLRDFFRTKSQPPAERNYDARTDQDIRNLAKSKYPNEHVMKSEIDHVGNAANHGLQFPTYQSKPLGKIFSTPWARFNSDFSELVEPLKETIHHP
ncbi:hypothetical protein [Stratiformator vulcanicus]|uniref:Uncharacterized protein n=1 Tax=Stratiformator vulcanicus TaxID=2527980 RepID=A0A517QWG8_9PLAN|nr:hypothetical protein [Stratiformator vulcanicus]QDT36006.1 hypothetical protein Pan189_03610 [Stratiformator vulcanicus]